MDHAITALDVVVEHLQGFIAADDEVLLHLHLHIGAGEQVAQPLPVAQELSRDGGEEQLNPRHTPPASWGDAIEMRWFLSSLPEVRTGVFWPQSPPGAHAIPAVLAVRRSPSGSAPGQGLTRAGLWAHALRADGKLPATGEPIERAGCSCAFLCCQLAAGSHKSGAQPGTRLC